MGKKNSENRVFARIFNRDFSMNRFDPWENPFAWTLDVAVEFYQKNIIFHPKLQYKNRKLSYHSREYFPNK